MGRRANRFDRLDIAILSALNENPRATSVDLSRIIPLSRTAIARRISILRDLGAFHDSAEIISYQAMGFEIEAVVDMVIHSNRSVGTNEELLQIPEVLSVSTTTGRRQSVLRVIAKDLSHFRRVAKLLQQFGDISSNLVLSTTASIHSLEDRLRLIRTHEVQNARPEVC